MNIFRFLFPWMPIFFLTTMSVFSLEEPFDSLVADFAQDAYSGEFSPPQLKTALLEVQNKILALKGADQAASRIEILLLAGQYYIDQGLKSDAVVFYNEAESLALDFMSANSPESRALLAEIRSQSLASKDLGYIIGNAGAILDEAEKALILRPDNRNARFVVAFGRLYSPGLFGGNPTRSLEIFEQILGSLPLENHVRFRALLGASEACRKLNLSTNRQEYLSLATQIYPRNLGLLKLKETKF